MSNINKLGNLNILDKKLIDIGDNFIDGSSFLPDLNIAKNDYYLKGNFKVNCLYDMGNEKRFKYFPKSVGGTSWFDFAPIVDMPERVLNASLIYLMYEGMKIWQGTPVEDIGLSQPLMVTTPISLANNNAPEMFESHRALIIDHSGTIPVQQSGIKLEGIKLTGDKIYSVMDDGELRSPRAILINSIGSSYVTFNPDVELEFQDEVTGQLKVIGATDDVAVGYLSNVKVEVECIRWQPIVGYVTTMETITCDLYFSAQWEFNNFDTFITVDYLTADDNLAIKTYGTATSGMASYFNVIDIDDELNFKAAFYYLGLGNGIYYDVRDGVINEKYFLGIPDISNKINYTSQKYGLYPFCEGAYINSGMVSVIKQSLEAIEPTKTGSNQESINLVDSVFDDTPSPLAIFSSGAYGVVAGVTKNNGENNFLLFVLRDASGYYELDISDIVPTNGYVDNCSFDGAVVTIGYYPDLYNYPDPINDPPPLKYAKLLVKAEPVKPERVELDFRKFIISFIPCMTHCMGKGGIVSKVY